MGSVIIGVDEAGRGPAVGPLVVSSICIPSEDLLHLESTGAKDSKAMNSKKRSEVESSILRESKKRDWRCLLYTSPSPRDRSLSRMPSSA